MKYQTRPPPKKKLISTVGAFFCSIPYFILFSAVPSHSSWHSLAHHSFATLCVRVCVFVFIHNVIVIFYFMRRIVIVYVNFGATGILPKNSMCASVCLRSQLFWCLLVLLGDNVIVMMMTTNCMNGWRYKDSHIRQKNVYVEDNSVVVLVAFDIMKKRKPTTQ